MSAEESPLRKIRTVKGKIATSDELGIVRIKFTNLDAPPPKQISQMPVTRCDIKNAEQWKRIQRALKADMTADFSSVCN